MRFDIRYRTVMTYDGLVRESQNELRACPASDERQQLIAYRVSTQPSARVSSSVDYFGTRVDAFGVRGPHLALEVLAEAAVETRQGALVTTAPRLDTLLDDEFCDLHWDYLQPSAHVDWGDRVAAAAARQREYLGSDVVSLVLGLHRLAGSSLTYTPGVTEIGAHVEDVFAAGHGVCQDIAHLAVAFCRSVGVPARYVSGYFFASDDSTGDDPDAEAVEVATHAWFEAAVPGFGWLALDPTNQREVGLRHVKIGHGRDYDDVPPLRGVVRGPGRNAVDAAVEMRRVQSVAHHWQLQQQQQQ
ncbi:MAG TPA: transglutaminase family protein [Acidimicrobiales bacterium]|nr:transglutaminase family protein [Acidimicrobiales bacterium]